MALYPFLVSIHVLVAVLGLGPLMALALLTKRPPLPEGTPRPMPPEAALRAFTRLLRVSQAGLGLMLLTGVVLVAMTHGAYGRQAWMITSVVLFLLIGATTGIAQSNLKKAAGPQGAVAHIELTHRLLLVASGFVAIIVWLMEAKPF